MAPEFDASLRINYNAEVIILTLLHKFMKDQVVCFATTLWSLWKHRNLRIWHDTTETSGHIF
jgi:hypothetical protein